MSNNLCAGCNLPIVDQFLSNVLDKVWHDSCVRCCECQTQLSEKCFSRDGKLYCKQDFYKAFGVKCAGCLEALLSTDLVRRVGTKVFHISCLKCHQCGREVATGEQLYVVNEGSFMCQKDYEEAILAFTSPGTSPCISNELGDISETCSREKKVSDDKGTPVNVSVSNEQGSDDDDDNSKRRGPRTTIKAKQLDVLKAAFSATPKPSRHVREKLAADTGLSMRVIQVWFQNRRSKERRVKQMSAVENLGRAYRAVEEKVKENADVESERNYHLNPTGQNVSCMDRFDASRYSYVQFPQASSAHALATHSVNTTLSILEESSLANAKFSSQANIVSNNNNNNSSSSNNNNNDPSVFDVYSLIDSYQMPLPSTTELPFSPTVGFSPIASQHVMPTYERL